MRIFWLGTARGEEAAALVDPDTSVNKGSLNDSIAAPVPSDCAMRAGIDSARVVPPVNPDAGSVPGTFLRYTPQPAWSSKRMRSTA
jgi:hypothetical protein